MWFWMERELCEFHFCVCTLHILSICMWYSLDANIFLAILSNWQLFIFTPVSHVLANFSCANKCERKYKGNKHNHKWMVTRALPTQSHTHTHSTQSADALETMNGPDAASRIKSNWMCASKTKTQTRNRHWKSKLIRTMCKLCVCVNEEPCFCGLNVLYVNSSSFKESRYSCWHFINRYTLKVALCKPQQSNASFFC